MGSLRSVVEVEISSWRYILLGGQTYGESGIGSSEVRVSYPGSNYKDEDTHLTTDAASQVSYGFLLVHFACHGLLMVAEEAGERGIYRKVQSETV